MSRRFNPRKIIPEAQLMQLLKDGWTLEEIGDRYNVSRSYISELCNSNYIYLVDVIMRNIFETYHSYQ